MKRLIDHREQSKRRGFVLVLTLAMILIAVMLTARTAHRSLSRTLQSLEAENRLRQRWEYLSLQGSLLSRANANLDEVVSKLPTGTTWLDGRFALSGHRYQVRLSDENAKVNLNQLRKLLTPEQSRRLTSSIDSVRSIPLSPSQELESWGQLFGMRSPADLMRATMSITCWGDGRLNIQRASDDSIRMLLEPVIGTSEVSSLIRRRSEQMGDTSHAQFSSSVPMSAQRLVTDQSRCFSLWVIDGETSNARFSIRESLDRSHLTTTFRW